MSVGWTSLLQRSLHMSDLVTGLTHWPLSFCEIILLAYATQQFVFLCSTLILCILQLPQYAGMSIEYACWGRL